MGWGIEGEETLVVSVEFGKAGAQVWNNAIISVQEPISEKEQVIVLGRSDKNPGS
jgi:archaeosine-15-forming tRNA-guanine transglycosylase